MTKYNSPSESKTMLNSTLPSFRIQDNVFLLSSGTKLTAHTLISYSMIQKACKLLALNQSLHNEKYSKCRNVFEISHMSGS